MAERPQIFPPGKLPGDVLAHLLQQYPIDDDSVLVGPEVGSDAAAIAFDNRVLVMKTDPITFPTSNAGRYLVNVNANDIACMGATPRWMLVTALLPEAGTTLDLVEELFADLHEGCAERGITLVGGHTEITIGLDRPILIGQMIGETERDKLLDLRRSQAGDRVILVNGIAIEGTAILASEAPEELLASLPANVLESARNYLSVPGISVVPAATRLTSAGIEIRGMHDPTEGGLATALAEIARVSGLGIRVYRDAILVRPETSAICELLDLNPMGLIASGALLAVVSEADAEQAVAVLIEHGFNAAVIGELSEDQALTMESGSGLVQPLPEFTVDEIARFFANLEHE